MFSALRKSRAPKFTPAIVKRHFSPEPNNQQNASQIATTFLLGFMGGMWVSRSSQRWSPPPHRTES